ncbi:hypothetical protein CYMTET_11457 [Cymbomonas tetramitiformis]|uniref:Uncharacterized protein n=1 Tax=Cymbomonas tetramitiformis TaxID=36881 RepID=A0AAE0GM96_9CHLO|nr:hypothetical protein CYMTET_11457 [Cymbomonas tetramitiformis]
MCTAQRVEEGFASAKVVNVHVAHNSEVSAGGKATAFDGRSNTRSSQLIHSDGLARSWTDADTVERGEVTLPVSRFALPLGCCPHQPRRKARQQTHRLEAGQITSEPSKAHLNESHLLMLHGTMPDNVLTREVGWRWGGCLYAHAIGCRQRPKAVRAGVGHGKVAGDCGGPDAQEQHSATGY